MFTQLPRELRERIYEEALRADGPIQPRLCHTSRGEKVKFHDELHKHNSIHCSLGVTMASRQLHAESLPIFYSVNTFMVAQDTATYFSRLEYLGRLQWIRQVRFNIAGLSVEKVPGVLRYMNSYIKAVDTFYWRYHRRFLKEGVTAKGLRWHPQYTHCGISHLDVLIVLRKLASPMSPPTTPTAGLPPLHYFLNLPLPTPSALTSNPGFPLVLSGLGINLHTFSNNSTVAIPGERPGNADWTWYRRFQVTDPRIQPHIYPIDATTGQTIAYASALALNPQLEQEPRVCGWTRMRTTCQGQFLKWEHVRTEGGGVST
ncbi:hypothetical protein GMOD_00003059 [Pyrenophora seminiperda CCB06]|uniref:Uncharacterized protein n=1 Tax=Pyrenophora seminiperda CCB06 TaxID=1302712 RepID=A0A3M7M3M8_9PLEO|nr:hypothetical protein GMOD_00003059 [Pyrenophora seminiperda CCB06]